MVPLVRLELTLLSESDFECDASTNSTTGACCKKPAGADYTKTHRLVN